jgi:hypothetical protein
MENDSPPKIKRSLTRKEREEEVADIFFASVVARFHQCLFSVDFDDPKTPNANVFEIFNKAWKTFAKEHNKKAKKIGANVNAFEEYAINQDIEI